MRMISLFFFCAACFHNKEETDKTSPDPNDPLDTADETDTDTDADSDSDSDSDADTDADADTDPEDDILSLSDLSAGDLIITEIMKDPGNVDGEFGEWFEIYNPKTKDIDMKELVVSDEGGRLLCPR